MILSVLLFYLLNATNTTTEPAQLGAHTHGAAAIPERMRGLEALGLALSKLPSAEDANDASRLNGWNGCASSFANPSLQSSATH